MQTHENKNRIKTQTQALQVGLVIEYFFAITFLFFAAAGLMTLV